MYLFCNIILFIYIIISTSIFYGSKILFIFGLISIFLILLNYNFKNIYFKYYHLLLLASITFLIFLSTPVDNYINLLSISTVIFITYLTVIILTSSCNISNVLFSVILFLNIHAFVQFLLQFLISIQSLPYISWAGFEGFTLFYIFYYRAYEDVFFKIYRSQGIFWEPGVAQLFYNLLLLYALGQYKSKKLFFISTFNLITSFSLTGYIIFMMIIIGRSRFRLLIFTALLFAVIISITLTDLHLLFGKSTYLRIFDTFKSFDILVKYPVLGIGLNPDTYQNFDYFDSFFSGHLIDSDLSRNGVNSVARVFAQLGIIGGTFFVGCLIRKNFVFPRGTSFVLLVTALAEPLLLSPFFILIMFIELLRPTYLQTSKL